MNSATKGSHYTVTGRINQVSLTEDFVAIQYMGRWEIYYVLEGGLEMFSHYATAGEAAQIERACAGAA